ncbi:Zn(II)2Cys6 transcription factor [Aspergillus lucknowensis]|uniref:Fungal-specific transcription factor domain-containing protein n=1 Tax=Aspergillus lucknowensis TaxID=176173 RepID=A0ABR4LXE9_9EURO
MAELVLDLGGTRRTKPPKSLSYTGCWTCRKRRIKCDERPGACRTCERAKLTCAGYDVRLIWGAGPNTSRRRIGSDKIACAPMTEDEVTRALTTVDKSAMKPSTTTVGPFSVFWSQSGLSSTASEGSESPQKPHNSCDGSPSQPHDNAPNDSPSRTMNSPLHTLSDTPPQCIDSIFDSAVPLCDVYSDRNQIPTSTQGPTPESSSQTQQCFDDADVEDIGRGVVTSSSPPSSSSSSSSSDTHEITLTSAGIDITVSQNTHWLDRTSNSPPEAVLGDVEFLLFDHDLASTVAEDTTASMLMNHYMQNVVHLMQPISHARNPFKTVYIPLALQGSSQLEGARRFNQLPSASVAVFHSLLSISAANLQSMRAEKEGLKQLACHHKQRALVALQSALAAKSTSYRDTMTAILSLVSTDIMDGGMSDHWIHLEAGIKLQESRHYSMLVSRETCVLNNICKMLHLFGQTTLPHLTSKPWPGYDHVPRGADFYFLEPSIEFLYGITTSIAGAIFKIYRLSQYVAYYRDHEQDYPTTLLEACETLADDLGSYTINSESFSSIDPSEAEALMVDIARAQAKAFHNAALIYYYRSIQQCSRSCLHQEQQAVLAAMNEAEDLKVSFGQHGSFPAPITWPAFVASCEAVGEERQRWDSWWSRVQVYGMRSYHQQYATVRGIWAKLDDAESDDWREVLATMGVRILPV